ncbi:hypothetical protein APZ19_28355 (plasmid) [Vibrio owensii]|uniref:Uncharacterized protein n=1 Tax=Vibrio owensii TaxID=696485 RepID=A0AAP9GJ33_9VIBR|nr:hypothetical protein [Vibrio owensii]QGH51060.1 hypothetical protein APZ19_28355 [Vibrio owensii]
MNTSSATLWAARVSEYPTDHRAAFTVTLMPQLNVATGWGGYAIEMA